MMSILRMFPPIWRTAGEGRLDRNAGHGRPSRHGRAAEPDAAAIAKITIGDLMRR